MSFAFMADVKNVCLAMIVLLGFVRPVFAAPVTLDFSGAFTFGPSDTEHTFTGSVTWDPATTLGVTFPNQAFYAATASSFALDGVAAIGGPVVGEIESVLIEICDSCAPGFDDVFGIRFEFQPFPVPIRNFPFGPVVDSIDAFRGFFLGPTTLFDSIALPADLGFLGDVTGSLSLICVGGAASVCALPATPTVVVGSFIAVTTPGEVPVPEPATIALLGASGASFLCRTWFRRRRR